MTQTGDISLLPPNNNFNIHLCFASFVLGNYSLPVSTFVFQGK